MSHNNAQKEKRAAALSSVFAAIGLTTFKIIVGVITNSLGILAEAALSYIGLGVQPPTPSLGVIMADGRELFQGVQSPFQAMRYHSLAVSRASLPTCLEVTAETDEGEVMGIRHKELPIWGVQFHPESIATEHGHDLLANFMRACGLEPKARGA